MLERLANAINCNVVMDREDRASFYGVLRAQLQAGVVARSACETLQSLPDLPEPWYRVARAGAQAGHEGRMIAEGWQETNLFPPEDIGVLRIAERTGTMPEAFASLEQSAGSNLSFLRKVILPNLYYLAILGVMIGLAWEAQGFLGTLKFDMTSNPAWILSEWLRTWGFYCITAITAGIAVVWYGKTNWVGPAVRKTLWVFDRESRYRVSLAFVRLAAMLSRQGASHTEILDAAGDVLGRSRFVAAAIRRARRMVLQEGARWEDAVSGGLLSAEHASLLAGLVPGEERSMYPEAYRTLQTVIGRMLELKYRRMAGLFRIAVFTGIAGIILTLASGIYGMTDTISLNQPSFR